jgi:hypothetical protein
MDRNGGYPLCIYPHYLKTYFKMLKKLKQKICIYIFTCYIPTKSFHDKLMCCVTSVKKINFGPKNKAFHMIFLSFFT